MKKNLYVLFAAFALASLVLAACGRAVALPNSDADIEARATAQAAAPAAEPTEAPAMEAPATRVPVTSSGGTTSCEDGKPLPNVLASTPDIPWGSKEGHVVAEIAWQPGEGYGGWSRIVAVAEKLESNEMPYANGVSSVSATLYCGDIDTVITYASTHAGAMAEHSGANVNEIPVVHLKRDGSIEIVASASNGPSQADIADHLELRLPDSTNTGLVSGDIAFSGIGATETQDHEGTDACVDGYILQPILNSSTATEAPFSSPNGAVIAEISWKGGPGFADWGRFIAVVERQTGGQLAYATDVNTVHATQYCGALTDIVAWSKTHVTAMINSSQESGGDRPTVDEIPIVFFRNDGTVEVVKTAPDGPSTDQIKAHLEMR